jgi:hypothetical protein
MSPHVFRHTATTLALSAGVPMVVVAAQMGHKSPVDAAPDYERGSGCCPARPGGPAQPGRGLAPRGRMRGTAHGGSLRVSGPLPAGQ